MTPLLEAVIAISMGGMMLAAALAVLFMKDLLSAVIATGFISLSASILFLLMNAPDVAITEASIGAVLLTLIFLWGLGKIGGGQR
ncbi:MAG: hydrogenase subunit MbhD domain-containing protein [Candidatus Aegiribacteria sp.]